MPAIHPIHRTAVFTLPQPTHRARARLERAFRDYTHAYETLLYVAYLRYGERDDLVAGASAGLDALREEATFAVDEKTGRPRMNARTLSAALFRGEELEPRAVEALARLPSRLRQSAREHTGQTLMSYVALADAWLQESPAQRGGAPQFPRRRRPADVAVERHETLAELASLADNRKREAALVARLLTTREPSASAIPFVGVADDYGCALYYCAETAGYYARLDIGAPSARDAGPLAMHGVYTQIKTGELWASERHLRDLRERGVDVSGVQSFGRRAGCVWLPIKLDEAHGARASYHRRALRFTRAAFLPDPTSGVAPAEPVSAKLVRQQTRDKTWYQFHVTFALPAEALDAPDDVASEERPLLGINRGLFHLYAAALMSPDARTELASFAAGGRELLARQVAMERARRLRQQRGKQPLRSRDRRQSRIATHEIHICANQIVEVARRARAQVVFEDMTSFASGAALRGATAAPRARQAALRSLLNRRQFEKLRELVDLRLALVALPPTWAVSAAYISQTCTACGERDRRSLEERRAAALQAGRIFDPRTFRCPSCGAEVDVDALAAVNVARKRIWLGTRAAEKRAGMSEQARTPWETFARDFAAC